MKQDVSESVYATVYRDSRTRASGRERSNLTGFVMRSASHCVCESGTIAHRSTLATRPSSWPSDVWARAPTHPASFSSDHRAEASSHTLLWCVCRRSTATSRRWIGLVAVCLRSFHELPLRPCIWKGAEDRRSRAEDQVLARHFQHLIAAGGKMSVNPAKRN